MLRSRSQFWVLAGLLTANLLVGVLSLYFIRAVNQRYAELFEHGAPVIYDLRTLTREVTGVQRLARRILSPDHETAWAELMPQMEVARDRVDARVRELSAIALFRDTPHPAAFATLNREYSTHVQGFLQLVRAGRAAEAAEFNLAVVRPCHDRFQQVLDAAADHIEAQGRNLRDRYARDSRFFGGVSLAFASVPLVAVSVGALVMTVLIGLLFLVILNPRPDRRY
jgi:hypothetical protein